MVPLLWKKTEQIQKDPYDSKGYTHTRRIFQVTVTYETFAVKVTCYEALEHRHHESSCCPSAVRQLLVCASVAGRTFNVSHRKHSFFCSFVRASPPALFSLLSLHVLHQKWTLLMLQMLLLQYSISFLFFATGYAEESGWMEPGQCIALETLLFGFSPPTIALHGQDIPGLTRTILLLPALLAASLLQCQTKYCKHLLGAVGCLDPRFVFTEVPFD